MSQVLLLGGDIAAYAAALELAEVGVKVWIADTAVSFPAYPVRDPGGEIAGFLREIVAPLTAGAPATDGAAPREVEQPRTVLRARDGAWKPVPEPSVWGIPAVPLSKECMAMLGSGGAFRAYLDRLKPVLTIGKENNLAKLIDSRLGRATRLTLVEPHVFERFGVGASDTEVARVEPGLNGALTRAGSLSGGVMQQFDTHVARETVIGPEVGWAGFGTLLRERLRLYGAEALPAKVVSCVSAEDGWIVTDDTGEQRHVDGVVGGHGEVSRVVVQGDAPWDVGSELEGSPSLVDHLVALRPVASREYVEIGIEGGAGRPSTGVPPGTLFLCGSEPSDTWAARVARGSAGEPVLILSGPASTQGVAGSAPIEHACALIDARPTATAPNVHTRAAAHATALERDSQAVARAELAEAYPTLIVAGEDVHGADLGEAIGEARIEAVRLRRKLTGISE